jgi:hypothetical protein
MQTHTRLTVTETSGSPSGKRLFLRQATPQYQSGLAGAITMRTAPVGGILQSIVAVHPRGNISGKLACDYVVRMLADKADPFTKVRLV